MVETDRLLEEADDILAGTASPVLVCEDEHLGCIICSDEGTVKA